MTLFFGSFKQFVVTFSITRKESKKTSRNHETRQNTKPFPNTKFIQTQGVFSEGSGEIRPSFGRSENHNNYRQHDVMPVPKIRKKSFNVSELLTIVLFLKWDV